MDPGARGREDVGIMMDQRVVPRSYTQLFPPGPLTPPGCEAHSLPAPMHIGSPPSGSHALHERDRIACTSSALTPARIPPPESSLRALQSLKASPGHVAHHYSLRLGPAASEDKCGIAAAAMTTGASGRRSCPSCATPPAAAASASSTSRHSPMRGEGAAAPPQR
jgi:hypothetical protein